MKKIQARTLYNQFYTLEKGFQFWMTKTSEMGTGIGEKGKQVIKLLKYWDLFTQILPVAEANSMSLSPAPASTVPPGTEYLPINIVEWMEG